MRPPDQTLWADVGSAARAYIGRGFAPVPVPYLNKRATHTDWPKLRIYDPDVEAYFPPGFPSNVGLLNGAPSRDLVDSDLDCREARAAAPFLLPPTGMVSGRESAPQSHWWYVALDGAPRKAAITYRDPVARTSGLLVELRSSGGMTIVPPSTYPADPDAGCPKPERCVWWRGEFGEPAQLICAEIMAAVGAVAAAALLGRYWPKSRRHACTLALAGGLLRRWPLGRVVVFVRAVCAAASDEEVEYRVRDVSDTARRLEGRENATGFPNLIRELGAHGPAIVAAVGTWLALPKKEKAEPGASFGDSRTGQGYEGSRVTRARYVPVPDYAPFPTDCLPPPWDAFVREGATALRCDEALVALPLLAVLAGAIGNTRRVQLGGEWFEPVIFWTCPIAYSGGMKTGAANLSIDLVRARQKHLMKAFKDAMKNYKRELKEYRGAGGEGAPGDEPDKPTLERVVVADVTIEKLAALHDDNRRGLLVARDELAGWFGSFTKYKGKGGGTDEPNWLSMHRGDAIVYDRKTGDKTSVFVPHAATSITGGIQPGVLRRLASHDLFESGMVARILFAMPPRAPKTWSDDEIPAATKGAASRSLDALFALRGAEDEDGDLCPVVVKLDRAAKERLERFVNEWGIRQFEAEGESAAALAKLEAVPGRFALLRHLVRATGGPDGAQPIGLGDLEAGIRLAQWCARETERVYAILAESAAETEIRKLLELATRLAGRNEGRVTVKLLQRANQRKYKTADAAKADLDKLVGLELGDWEPAPARAKGGWRPTYFILRKRSCETCDASDPWPNDGDINRDSEACDPCPDAPGTVSQSFNDTIDTSRLPNETYADDGDGSQEQGSEASHVSHDREMRIRLDRTEKRSGAEDPPVSGSRVIQMPPAPIATAAGVMVIAAAIAEWSGPIGVDTETTGLDPARDRVRLLQVARGDAVVIIDVFALSAPSVDLAPLFAALTDKEIVGHNLQFDLRMLAPLGLVPGRVFDTMLASRVLHAGGREETNARLKHGLADAVERESGLALDKGEQVSDWSGQLTAKQLAYAAADVTVLLPLAAALKDKLAAANLTATAEREMRALPGVAWARPIVVDVPAWLAIAAGAEAERRRSAEAMDELAPNPAGLPGMETRNWDSPAQVMEAFKQIAVPVAATGDDTLAGIAHPLARLVRDYRGAAKRVGTYGRGWVAKHVGPNDLVRPSWNQLGAESGRMSCSDPNLQQVPRGSEYRRCFVARPGRVLVKADYSQVELRIAAKVANEGVMIAAYKDRRDLHALTAARVLNKPESAVTKADRQLAKAVNFGLVFGMGWRGLKAYAQVNYGVELADAQARGYREAFFRTYPALRAWHTRTEAHVKKRFDADPNGTHAVFTLGGRRRVLPVAKKGTDGTPYPNKTDALNTPVQGTGADGLKAAIALLWERRAECPGAVPVIFCHDEIVLEVPESNTGRAQDWLRRCMVEAVAPLIDPVPIEVEVSAGRTWGG